MATRAIQAVCYWHRLSICRNEEVLCGARNSVELERLTCDRFTKAVTDRSGIFKGPTAITETVDSLELLARVLVHLCDWGT